MNDRLICPCVENYSVSIFFFRSECRENFSLFHSVFILCVSRNHWSCCLIPIAAQCVQGVFSDNRSSFCPIFTVCPFFSISALYPGGPQNLAVQAFPPEYLFPPDDSIVAILKFLACRAFFPPRRGCAAGRPEFGLFDQKGRKTRIRVFRHFPLIRFSGGVRPSWSKSLNSGFSTFLVENLEFGFFDFFGRKTRIRVFRRFWSEALNSGFSTILVEKPEFGFFDLFLLSGSLAAFGRFGRKTRIRVFRSFWSKNPNSGFRSQRVLLCPVLTPCVCWRTEFSLSPFCRGGWNSPRFHPKSRVGFFSSSIVQVAGVVSSYHGFLLRPALPASDVVCAMTFIH